MKTTKKRIAIIGAGVSGLCAVIMMKQEGLEPICFEKTDKPGGTWCYRENSTPGLSSIMPSTVLDHSKELGAFSNFPPDKTYNNFMKHNEIYKYLLSYWTRNDALRYVRFNTEVLKVKQALNYEKTGQWVVSVNDMSNGIFEDIYDAVIVCNGYLTYPKMPTFKGQNKFKGHIIHSHSLKDVLKYKDKKVVVVGMGCSGLDAAVEISNVAEKVFLSTRSGAYVLNRMGPNGFPSDIALLRRYLTVLIDILPIKFLSWLLEILFLDPKFNSNLYSVKPHKHYLCKPVAISDHFNVKLLNGTIIQKRDILEFTEKGVTFDGDDDTTEIDSVIMATGYEWKCPFLGIDVLVNDNDGINLYKYIWPVQYEHPTMAFVGCIYPFGPLFPIMELQCRYIAQVISGKKNLPPTEVMLTYMKNKNKKQVSRFAVNIDQPPCVDYVQYLDEIAKEIDAKPNFLKLMFTDPCLFYTLIVGPSVPYQYRLQGPHTWQGAREAIMTVNQRIRYPLKHMLVKKLEPFYVEFLRKFLLFILPSHK